MYFMIVDSLNG